MVSDLHVGVGARSKDLCPPHVNTKAAETGYKDRFLKFLRKTSLRADYLVIPGDVSHMADPSEFQLASQIVSDIARVLAVQQKRVIFVPGNHDVDWTVLRSDDPTGFRRTQRYAPLRHRNWVFGKIMGRGRPDVLEPPHFCTWNFDNVLAVGYNSSWHDDPTKAVHNGIIGDDHLPKLEEHLAKLDLSPSRLRLFLVHHHPVQYSDPVNDPPDFSVMTNAGNLLALLQKYHFDLLIHGHKHKPNFETHIINSSFPLAILCAGSFSVELDTRWSGHVNNQFHVVRVEGRDSDAKNIFGRVESWTYLCGKGWLPSKLHNGIRHIEPFGTYLQPEALKKRLGPLLQEKLQQHNHLEWSEVLSELHDLKYLPPDLAMQVLDALGSELHFRRHGEPPEEVILVKQGVPSGK